MASTERPPRESAWRRGGADLVTAEHIIWRVQALVSIFSPVAPALFLQEGTPVRIAMTSAVGSLLVAATVSVLLLLWCLARAPYRQRNEARELVEAGRSRSAEPPAPIDMAEHHQSLLRVLEDVDQAQPLTHNAREWLPFYFRPDETWEIPDALARWQDQQRLHMVVELKAEKTPEWPYIQQHLAGHQVLEAVTVWKSAIGEDLVARVALVSRIANESQASSGLVLREGNVGRDRWGLSDEYLLHLCQQVFLQVGNFRWRPYKTEEFQEAGNSNDIALGSHILLSSDDSATRARAVEHFVEAQHSLALSEEAARARVAYANAHTASEALRRLAHVAAVIDPGLPPGSTCDSCAPFVQLLSAEGANSRA